MLYDYKLNISEMGKVKNYKKANNFNHILLNIEDINLSIYEVKCRINYKKTVPLNMFEKYSIRLIDKANEIGSSMSISNIAKFLHLDEGVIKQNIENLEQIGMISNKGNIIFINKDKNAEYLQFENKFKMEKIDDTLHVTRDELQNMEKYLIEVFEKDKVNNDKKFDSYNIIDNIEATKKVKLLSYSDNKFLIFSNNGVNSKNDLKFISSDTFSNVSYEQSAPENTFCHYQEFLPILRDILSINKNNSVIISSKDVKDDSLDVLKSYKNIDNLFILSRSSNSHKRAFDLDMNEFVWIDEDFYFRENNFIIKENNKKLKQQVKENLEKYFFEKIKEVEPLYNFEEIEKINSQLDITTSKLDSLKFRNSKDFDKQINILRTNKNKLYGIVGKRKGERIKRIDNFEFLSNEKELQKYPEYLKNKDEIFELKDKIAMLEKGKEEFKDLNDEKNKLNRKKSSFISKENKSIVVNFEKELRKIEKLKV